MNKQENIQPDEILFFKIFKRWNYKFYDSACDFAFAYLNEWFKDRLVKYSSV